MVGKDAPCDHLQLLITAMMPRLKDINLSFNHSVLPNSTHDKKPKHYICKNTGAWPQFTFRTTAPIYPGSINLLLPVESSPVLDKQSPQAYLINRPKI